MFLCTVATYCCCLALGSYVAVVLALVALFQSTLSFVPLALKQLSLPYQAFVDDLVRILWSSELYDDAGCRLAERVRSLGLR